MKKKLIIINCFVFIILLVDISRISSLTMWGEIIFQSKYEKAEIVYGGSIPDSEQGKIEARILEFDEKYRTDTKILVEVLETDDTMLFKVGDKVYIESTLQYYNEDTKEYIYTNDGIPENIQMKVGDEVIVEYYWAGMEFKYSNCFFTVMKEKNGYKYMPSGAFVCKVINLPEEIE